MSPTKSDVSICMVNCNAREVLADSLKSILESERGIPFEVIVVDNGAPDGSADMIERNLPSVRLLWSERNLLFGRGTNWAATFVGVRLRQQSSPEVVSWL